MTKSNIQFIYQYVLTSVFTDNIKEKKLKELYAKLLSSDTFDGFSEMTVAGDEGSDMVLNSKSNEYELVISNFDLELTVKNPLESDFDEYASNPQRIIEVLNDLIEIFNEHKIKLFDSDSESISVSLEKVYFNSAKVMAVGHNIFNKKLVDQSFGYTAKFMTHIDDDSLRLKHVHSRTAIHNAYVNESREEPLAGAMNDKNSYILSIKYDYDIHDNSFMVTDDSFQFINQYTAKLEPTIDDIAATVGLAG